MNVKHEPLSAARIERLSCSVCRQRMMRRVERPFEYEVSHDGRSPVKVRIPSLSVIACTNPACHPTDPAETVLHDDATHWQITVETYRQLGLLMPDEIRASREKLGLTQAQLQELLGLGGNSLSRWETGRVYQSRSMDRLLRVALQLPTAVSFLQQFAATVPAA